MTVPNHHMSNTSTPTNPLGPQALLPLDDKAERPLFVLLSILAFLATLALLSVSANQRMSKNWRTELTGGITVQIKPTQNQDEIAQTEQANLTEQAKQAQKILNGIAGVESAEVLPQARSRELLNPWLGDMALPDDLSLPILIDARISPRRAFDKTQVQQALQAAGIRADIDDRTQWSKQVLSSTRAAHIMSVLALIVIISASIGAAIFATQGWIAAQRPMIEVLHQIGAAPKYTARLFSTRFGILGFKAGVLGAVAAILITVLIGLLFNVTGMFSYFIPTGTFVLKDILVALFVPFGLAIILAGMSWRTILATLYSEIYP